MRKLFRFVALLVAATTLLSIAAIYSNQWLTLGHAASSPGATLTLAILHANAAESKGLARLLRRLGNRRDPVIPHLLVVNGVLLDNGAAEVDEVALNATAAGVRVVNVPRAPAGLAGCYAHALAVADSRFLAVVAAEDLDRVRDDVLPDVKRLVDWLVRADKHDVAPRRVLLFAPSRVARFATFSAAMRDDAGALADNDLSLILSHRFANKSARFQLEPIPAAHAHLIHDACRDDEPVPNATVAVSGGLMCSPVSWVSPRFGFLARTDVLRSLPPQRGVVWDMLRESLALQWFTSNVSVMFCSNVHTDQCHIDVESATNETTTLDDALGESRLRGVSNISALALCAQRPDVGSLVFDRWAVDCNVGTACANGAKNRQRLAASELGATCIDDRMVRALYRRGPRFPTLISCDQIHDLHQELIANGTQPFARGAHKAVFESKYHDLPLVIKQVFFASASRPSSDEDDDQEDEAEVEEKDLRKRAAEPSIDGGDDDEVASFVKTFERQVLDEFYYTNRWAPNPMIDNPFVMQIYGLCIGSAKDTQLMAAEGPLLPWSAAAKAPELPWFARLAIAINLTRTIDFLHRQHVVLCGLNMEQVAIDNQFNAKVIDLDTLIETHYLSDRRLGEGMECVENGDCVRVPAVRMTPYAIEDLPDRTKETTNRKGALILYFKEPRQGSRGSARHRSCLPKAPECRCNATNVCVGFDGASMLAASLDSLLRPLLDRSRFTASREFYAAIDQVFARLMPGSCAAPRVAASAATALFTEVANRFGALAELERSVHEMRRLQARLVSDFIVTHRARCEQRGEFTKCAA
jgi:hypothetical protein